jgi:nicotinamidase-related amidase
MDRVNQGGIMKSGRAFIGVDLVVDFVDGKFGSENAKQVAERAEKFLKKIDSTETVVLTLDSHMKNDPEFRVWGEHCLRNTTGSSLYGDLDKINAYHVEKRFYDAFFQSDLDGFLRAKEIRELYIFGISTDICVLHTVAGAFFRYYNITIIDDLCASLREEDHNTALMQMKRLYGVRTIKSNELVKLNE